MRQMYGAMQPKCRSKSGSVKAQNPTRADTRRQMEKVSIA